MTIIVWSSAEEKTLRDVVAPILVANEVPNKVVPKMSAFPPAVQGDVVLACGTTALKTLQGMGLVPKNRTITSLREKPVAHNGATIFVTFDPGICYRDYERRPEVQWDVQLTARYHKTGSVKPVVGSYRYVESYHELIQQVEEQYWRTGKPVDVSCDLETKSFNPYNPQAWVIACSFTIEEGRSDVVYFEKGEAPTKPLPWLADDEMSYWEELWVQLNWLLTTPKISLRGANFKFDSNWIYHKWGISVSNQKFDTMLVGSLLDENRSNSLKLHAKIMTPMGGYEDDMDKYDFGSLELVPKEELLQYVGGDTDATYRVAVKMKADLLKDKALSNFYVKLLQPSAKVFEKMERNGLLVDQEYYGALKAELEAEIANLQQAMINCMPNKLKIKHKDSIADAIMEGKSPLKPSILKEFLFSPAGLNLKPKVFTAKTGEPSTSMDHLMMFGDDPVAKQFIDAFKDMGSAQKTYSTYVVGFMKHLRQDGRFHPQYFLAVGDFGGGSDQGTNCLTGDSKILTKRGEVRADSILVGDQVITHLGRWRVVRDVIKNGVKPVLELKVGGNTLRCTPNHPLLTTTGWVFAEDIIPEFHHVICYNKNLGGRDGELERGGRVSGLLHIRSRKTTNGYASEGALSWDSGGVGREQRVQVFHSEEQSWQSFTPSSPIGGGTFSPSPKGGASRGEAPRRSASELPLEESSVGYVEGESSRHGEARNGDRRVTKSACQVGQAYGVSYRERLGISLWRRGVQEAPNCGSYCFSDQEWGPLGFEAVVVSAVNFIGYEETFDITVEEDHSFVVEGIVTHNTGRTSASAPAVQTIPKHSKWAKKLRKGYIAPPGKAILQLDFSQGELRIAAVVAKEPTMIKAYADGMDLHAITAAKLSGYEMGDFMLLPEELRDELRSGGKAGNFGLLYGMGATGFQTYAYTTYGVKMTEEEAHIKRDAFFDLYSRLPEWHEESRNYAHMWGFVRSPLGRVRHLPLINAKDRDIVAQAERQSINSQIQSCLSDMMQLAMVHIDREYGDQVEMCLMCHDSIAAYVPEGEVTVWAKRLKDILENLPLERDFGFISPLKFVADAEAGPNLAELKKLKNLN